MGIGKSMFKQISDLFRSDEFIPSSAVFPDIDKERLVKALLHKSVEGHAAPFPERIYPTASVTGMPRAV